MQKRSLLEKIKDFLSWNYFGISLVSGVVVLAVIQALQASVPGHYRIFVEAAHNLWIGKPAYGVPLVGNLFFYSPSYALVFFGPLSLLPEKLGLLIYLVFSASLFIYAVSRFARCFISSGKMNFYWLLLAQPLFSSLGAHKPEVMIVGLLFLAASWMMEGRRWVWASFFLAAVCNWKIQPFPAVALLAIHRVLKFRDFQFPIVLFGFLGFWFALPFAIQPVSLMAQAYQVWWVTLGEFSRISYIEFDNIYSFLQNFCGISLSYFQAQILSISAAILTGVGFIFWCGFSGLQKDSIQASESQYSGVLLALAAGLSYTAIFSPLQQVQAYILLAPLYFALWLIASKPHAVGIRETSKTRFWWGLLIFTFIVMSFAYSDLVPIDVRNVIRHWTIRSGLALILTVALWIKVFQTGWRFEMIAQKTA